ncbi:MAG: chemotaxis protein CheW [Candidatus Sericytochromatia bacterium]
MEAVKPYLVFRVSDRLCALPLGTVQSIFALPALSVLPGMPRLLLGFVTLAGQSVPVLELARLLDLPEQPEHIDQHLLLLQPSRQLCRVERVLEIASLPDPRPLSEQLSVNDAVVGVFDYRGEALWLLEPARLLLQEEQQRVDELRERMQLRLQQLETEPA